MNKNTKNISTEFKAFFKAFFHNRVHSRILIPLTVAFSLALAIYALADNNLIFPLQKNLNYSFFTDKANDGTSEISNELISDSIIQFDFLMKEGFMNPYVGISINPTPDTKGVSLINLKPSNQIIIDLYTEGLENIGFFINCLSKSSEVSEEIPELRFFHSINAKPGRNSYTISLDDFKIPDWYLDQNKLNKQADLSLNTAAITYINITSAYPTKVGDNGKVKIYEMSFSWNNKNLSAVLISLWFLMVCILLLIQFIRIKLNTNTELITVAYQATDVSEANQNDKSYLSFINTNFNNPELTLEMVSKNCAIGQRIIANEIQASFNCNFKSYINQIRINESKRLLETSSLNMGEIAYKVGFNSQSHFNRVFKSLSNSSPGSYKDGKN